MTFFIQYGGWLVRIIKLKAKKNEIIKNGLKNK